MQIAQNLSSISTQCDKKSSELHQELDDIEENLKNYQKIQNFEELPEWGEWRACTRRFEAFLNKFCKNQSLLKLQI